MGSKNIYGWVRTEGSSCKVSGFSDRWYKIILSMKRLIQRGICCIKCEIHYDNSPGILCEEKNCLQYIIRNLFYDFVRNLSHPLIFPMSSPPIVNNAFTHNNFFVAALRAKLREKRGIVGSLTNDIILTICCGYCTLVQVCTGSKMCREYPCIGSLNESTECHLCLDLIWSPFVEWTYLLAI